MSNPLKVLLQNIEGEWISHQTIYSLQDKQIKINKKNILVKELNFIHKNKNRMISYLHECKTNQNERVLYQYLYKSKSFSSTGIINKIYMNINKKYRFTLSKNNHLKVDYKIRDIKSTEYIYSINTNFKISIIIVKKLNQYLAICFNSQIKITK